VSGFGLFSGRL